MKTNVINCKRLNPYSQKMEDFCFFIEITNCQYKPVTQQDKYFCVTFRELNTDPNLTTQIFYNITRNKEMAEILRVDVYEFNYMLQKYDAIYQLEGGHYFTDYQKAKQFIDNYIVQKLIIMQLAG